MKRLSVFLVVVALIALPLGLWYLFQPKETPVTFDQLLAEARSHRLKSVELRRDGSLAARPRAGRIVYRVDQPPLEIAELRAAFEREAGLAVEGPRPWWKVALYFTGGVIGAVLVFYLGLAILLASIVSVLSEIWKPWR